MTPARIDPTDPLNVMQRRFVQEYLIDTTNATQAAIRAGYSPVAGSQMAYKLLHTPAVRAAIESGLKERAEKMGITKDRVLQELALIAFSNLKDVITHDENGDTTVDLSSLSRQAAAPLKEVSVKTTRGKTTVKEVKISLADKQAALVTIGKHLGLFKDQVEVSGQITLEKLVLGSFEPDSLPQEAISNVPDMALLEESPSV